jgi:hypothetical protein
MGYSFIHLQLSLQCRASIVTKKNGASSNFASGGAPDFDGAVDRSPSLEERREFFRAYFLPKVPAVSIRRPLEAMMIFR